MPVDPRIALGFQAPQMPDFGEIASRRMQAMNMMSQMRQADEERAQQNAFRNYVQGGGLTNDPLAALQFGAPGVAALNAATNLETVQRQRKREDVEQKDKERQRAESLLGTAIMRGYENPSDENLDNILADLETQGVDTSTFRYSFNQVKDPVQRKNFIGQYLQGTEEGRTFMDRYASNPVSTDLGDRIEVTEGNTRRNDYGNVIRIQAKGVSPDAASAARSAEENRKLQREIALTEELGRNERAAAELAAKTGTDEKTQLARQNAVTYANFARDSVKEALKTVGSGEAGIIGAAASLIPGTRAYAVANSYYETIKSALSLERLAEIRQASPTGGALGNISNRENDLLGASVAALDVGLSKEDQQRNLRKIDSALTNIAKINRGEQPIPRVTTDAEAAKVPSGTLFYDDEYQLRRMP